MKMLARTLIVLIVCYSIGFPLAIGYSKMRKSMFPHSYRTLIRDTAKKHGLDPLFVAALIYSESSFKPKAVSKSGAVGLMQIMPATALQLAKKMKLEDFQLEQLYSPKINVELGCFFLSQLSNEFDDFQKILIAYNAGRGNLIRWSGEGDLLSKTFPETRRYVIKVRRVYWFLRILHGVQGFY
jgi:soluble lytic murein transglycosylase